MIPRFDQGAYFLFKLGELKAHQLDMSAWGHFCKHPPATSPKSNRTGKKTRMFFLGKKNKLISRVDFQDHQKLQQDVFLGVATQEKPCGFSQGTLASATATLGILLIGSFLVEIPLAAIYGWSTLPPLT